MRVGLITYHFSHNPGAVFQAYALREWLRRRGVDTEFINYQPWHVEAGGTIRDMLDLRHPTKAATIAYLRSMELLRHLRQSRLQRDQAAAFQRKFLGIKETGARHAGDLQGLDTYDLLICGSDQIWNPSRQFGLDPAYFLEFGRTLNVRRISYAPSFGIAELAPAYRGLATRLISQLDAVSVREPSGTEIVRQLTGRQAVCVPDPTVLLGDFSQLLTTPPPRKGHVFCYALRTSEMVRDVALYVGKSAGVEVIQPVPLGELWIPIGKTVKPGPQEWLQLLNAADTVVTNTFHGAVFSVLLNKRFVCVPVCGKRSAYNMRTQNFLTAIGLLDRLTTSANPKEIDSILKHSIDWTAVNARLATMRQIGSDYLDGQLALTR